MARRGYFKVCRYCGANLDPGERCTCQLKTPPEQAGGRSQWMNLDDKRNVAPKAYHNFRENSTWNEAVS